MWHLRRLLPFAKMLANGEKGAIALGQSRDLFHPTTGNS
jgi:hypothetical protein